MGIAWKLTTKRLNGTILKEFVAQSLEQFYATSKGEG